MAREQIRWFVLVVETDSDSRQGAKNGMPDGPAAPAKTIRHLPFRRNLLFLATLLTLALVFIGAVPLGETLMAIPFAFALYWSACFFLVAAVLMLALYDLMRVRRDHRKEARTLEKELAAAAADVREMLLEAEEERGPDQR